MLKRNLLLGGALLTAGLGAVAAIGSLALANETTGAPATGRYYFNAVDIREVSRRVIEFCDEFGTLQLDPGGTGMVTATRRCNGGMPIGPEANPITWVSLGGDEIAVTEVGFPGDTVHGRFLRGGQIFLFDSTSMTNPTRFVLNGVGVRD